MSALDLAKELGLSTEELTERVVDRCAESVLRSVGYDEDGERETAPTQFARKLESAVIKRIDRAIDDLASTHVLPNVTGYLENLTMQETNSWGEAKGKKLTFIEYLVSRTEHWLTEEVDFQGKSKKQSDSYSWRGTQTRIAHLLHQHLHYGIENAIKESLKNAHSTIANGLTETVKVKLGEIAEAIKVEVKTK